MPGDAISSGFDCISRRFPAGLLAVNQGESTQKCSQRRRKCASGILETHSRDQGTGIVGAALRRPPKPSPMGKVDLTENACILRQRRMRSSCDQPSVSAAIEAPKPMKALHRRVFRALDAPAVGYPIGLAALGHFSTGLPDARAQCCALGPIAHGRAPSCGKLSTGEFSGRSMPLRWGSIECAGHCSCSLFPVPCSLFPIPCSLVPLVPSS